MATLKSLLLLGLFFLSVCEIARADDPPQSIRVATWNLEWFFDEFKTDNRADLAKEQSAPSRAEWEWKLAKVAEVIAKLEPTILALQEIESRDGLFRLTKILEEKHQQKYKHCLIEGFDFGTEQQVAFLYKDGLVEYARREQTLEMYNSKQYYNLTKHLIGRFEWGSGDKKQRLTILNLHLRAAPEQEELRIKQCRLAREFLKEEIARGENVIVVGDVNTEHQAGIKDGKTDLGVLCGFDTSDTKDDLVDLNQFLPAELRPTHLCGKQFDHFVVSPAVVEDAPSTVDLVYNRIVSRKDLVVVGEPDKDHFNVYYQIPQAERDISDHYPVMVEILLK
ncbi:MAG: endonuclease/exonuclease/phosphatase family protein [Pirellulaceae bacterium]